MVYCQLLAVGLLNTCGSFGFIYQTHILQKWDPVNRNFQRIVGLGDFHDKVDPVNQQQLNDLMGHLGQLNPCDVKILTEDLSSCGTSGSRTCGRFYINSRGGVLGGLAADCKSKGFDVGNVEYRFCRVVSLSPLLRSIQENPGAFPSTNQITMGAIINEVDEQINKIQQFNDGPVLRELYTRNITQVLRQMAVLKLDRMAQATVAEYITNQSRTHDRLSFVKDLLTFDSDLLDCWLLHEIVNARNKKTVLFVAGGSHIERVVAQLRRIGYESLHSNQGARQPEYDLSKCLGSHIIDSNYCMRPEPVSLQHIGKYF